MEKFRYWDSLKNRTLRLAVMAQFFYVGAQVCVTSFFVRMGMRGGGLDEKTAGYYLGIYGLLFMVGRFVGTILLRGVAAGRLLSIYAVACILLTLVAIIYLYLKAGNSFDILVWHGLALPLQTQIFLFLYSMSIKTLVIIK